MSGSETPFPYLTGIAAHFGNFNFGNKTIPYGDLRIEGVAADTTAELSGSLEMFVSEYRFLLIGETVGVTDLDPGRPRLNPGRMDTTVMAETAAVFNSGFEAVLEGRFCSCRNLYPTEVVAAVAESTDGHLPIISRVPAAPHRLKSSSGSRPQLE